MALDKEQLKHDPLAEAIINFIAKVKPRWKELVLYTAIGVLIIILASNFVMKKDNLPVEAGKALAFAGSAADIENVVIKYPGTYAASAGLMQLGALAVQQTNFSMAIKQYNRIENECPNSFLIPAARLAVAKCYIALGNYKDAEDILKRDLLYDRDHYASLLAQMELVRVLTAMGRYKEALNEMQLWDRSVANSYLASMGSGIREQLMRVTGVSTNLQQQAYENSSL